MDQIRSFQSPCDHQKRRKPTRASGRPARPQKSRFFRTPTDSSLFCLILRLGHSEAAFLLCIQIDRRSSEIRFSMPSSRIRCGPARAAPHPNRCRLGGVGREHRRFATPTDRHLLPSLRSPVRTTTFRLAMPLATLLCLSQPGTTFSRSVRSAPLFSKRAVSGFRKQPSFAFLVVCEHVIATCIPGMHQRIATGDHSPISAAAPSCPSLCVEQARLLAGSPGRQDFPLNSPKTRWCFERTAIPLRR
jgi:hypothetical protein